MEDASEKAEFKALRWQLHILVQEVHLNQSLKKIYDSVVSHPRGAVKVSMGFSCCAGPELRGGHEYFFNQHKKTRKRTCFLFFLSRKSTDQKFLKSQFPVTFVWCPQFHGSKLVVSTLWKIVAKIGSSSPKFCGVFLWKNFVKTNFDVCTWYAGHVWNHLT